MKKTYWGPPGRWSIQMLSSRINFSSAGIWEAAPFPWLGWQTGLTPHSPKVHLMCQISSPALLAGRATMMLFKCRNLYLNIKSLKFYQSLCPVRDKKTTVPGDDEKTEWCARFLKQHLQSVFWTGEAVVSVQQKKGKAESRKNVPLARNDSGWKNYFRKNIDAIPTASPTPSLPPTSHPPLILILLLFGESIFLVPKSQEENLQSDSALVKSCLSRGVFLLLLSESLRLSGCKQQYFWKGL